MTTLNIKGMTCDHCVKHVLQALQAVPGVEAVTVDRALGKAEVTGVADVLALLAAVEEEGYQAETIA